MNESPEDSKTNLGGWTLIFQVSGLCAILGLLLYLGFVHYAPRSPVTQTPSVIGEGIKSAVSTSFSSSTPERVLNTINIEQAIPPTGKFIAADLVNMNLLLYQDGTLVAEYPLKSKGRAGTPWETPSGFYTIQTKERKHFSSIGKVYMPFSMQFYGNYFIHGWTYYPDGTPTTATFSGGCIKLATENAQKVYEFAEVGTKVFVYDPKQSPPPPTLGLAPLPKPAVNAAAFLVADVDTGDVYAESNAKEVRPIASVTKLMTSLVANEVISLDKKVTIPEGILSNPENSDAQAPKTFLVDELFYPLLMQSSNSVANELATYYGARGFVHWMNTTAQALDMTSTSFEDPTGISPNNVSNAEDLFRLATYLSNKKTFVLKITKTPIKTIRATDGTAYEISNVNAPADMTPFDGGKAGHTQAAEDTMLSVLSFDAGGTSRRVAIIVLGSIDQKKDTKELADWITQAARSNSNQAACASCATTPSYRKIEL